MDPSSLIRSLLSTGDRRTVGSVPEVVKTVSRHVELLPDLIDCLFDGESAVRMRAADALEKFSRVQAEALVPYTSLLLNLFEKTPQQELLWHLAVMLPRLPLGPSQCLRAATVLQSCLEAPSSIVKHLPCKGWLTLQLRHPPLNRSSPAFCDPRRSLARPL